MIWTWDLSSSPSSIRRRWRAISWYQTILIEIIIMKFEWEILSNYFYHLNGQCETSRHWSEGGVENFYMNDDYRRFPVPTVFRSLKRCCGLRKTCEISLCNLQAIGYSSFYYIKDQLDRALPSRLYHSKSKILQVTREELAKPNRQGLQPWYLQT